MYKHANQCHHTQVPEILLPGSQAKMSFILETIWIHNTLDSWGCLRSDHLYSYNTNFAQSIFKNSITCNIYWTLKCLWSKLDQAFAKLIQKTISKRAMEVAVHIFQCKTMLSDSWKTGLAPLKAKHRITSFCEKITCLQNSPETPTFLPGHINKKNKSFFFINTQHYT